MRIIAVLILLLAITFTGFSQEVGEEIRNGQLHKIHIVEAGNTLYGLHRKYDATIDAIIKANPIVKDGLQIGQKLYIPVSEDEQKPEVLPYITHTVRKKETLYGISRAYGCSVEEIVALNPGVENGLRTGEEIKIPKKEEVVEEETPKVSKEVSKINEIQEERKTSVDSIHGLIYQAEFSDSIVEYEVQKGETLYSISRRFMVPVESLVTQNNIKKYEIKPGQILKITLKKERIQEVEMREVSKVDSSVAKRPDLVPVKDSYKVLIALPMKIVENAEVLSGMYNESTSLNKFTDLSIDFLMGAQMAIDSLEQLGLNAEIEFYDTEGDLNKFKKHIGVTNDKNLDMIIGPFYPNLLEYAAKWGAENKVPVVAVTKIPTKILENNPYLLSMVPSDLTLISGMAKYLAKHYSSANFVLMEGENEEVKQRVAYFKAVLNKSLAPGEKVSLKMIASERLSESTLGNAINSDQKNFVICFSHHVQQVMQFVNTLNATKNLDAKFGKTDITMVGLQDWRDLSALNSYYKNRFEFHFAATNYLNYDTPKVASFTRKYRERYGSDPSKYAFHGFDVLLSQGAFLFLGYPRNEGLMNNFSVHPLGSNHGSENSSVFIAKQIDFDIQLLEIISNNNHFDVKRVE